MRISGARTKKWADLSRLKKEQPPKLIRNERKSRDELPTLDTYGLKRTSLQRLLWSGCRCIFLSTIFIVSSNACIACNRRPPIGTRTYVALRCLNSQFSQSVYCEMKGWNFKRCAKGRWSWNRGCHLSRLNKNSFKLDVPHRYFRTTVFLFFLFCCLFQCLFGCVRRLV